MSSIFFTTSFEKDYQAINSKNRLRKPKNLEITNYFKSFLFKNRGE